MFLGGIWRLDYQREQFLQKHFSPRSNFLLDFDLIWREQVGALKIFIIIKKRCKRGQKVVSKERKGDGSQAISIVQVFLWLSCLLQKENTLTERIPEKRSSTHSGFPLIPPKTQTSLWEKVFQKNFPSKLCKTRQRTHKKFWNVLIGSFCFHVAFGGLILKENNFNEITSLSDPTFFWTWIRLESIR